MLNKYKKNELVNESNTENESDIFSAIKVQKELFFLLCLSYQKFFHLITFNIIKLKEYEYFLYINDKEINIKKAENAIKFLFKDKKKRLIILFSFLDKIHEFIETKIDGKTTYQLYLLNSEYLDISKETLNYFISLIEYTSRETRIMTIYNYIECIVYDINKKKMSNNKCHCFINLVRTLGIHFLGFDEYKFFEILNLISFIGINILLIIFYYKPRPLDDEEYNEIDNRQNFMSVQIWALVHIIILIIIFIYWIITRLKNDYFYSMTKHINEFFKESEKLKMGRKVKLLKRDLSEFTLNSFYPEKLKDRIKNSFNGPNYQQIIGNKISYMYFMLKIYVYTLKTINPFLVSLIGLILSFWSQIFFILPLFIIFINLLETIWSIFLLIKNESATLGSLAIYFILILYIFSWIGFFYFPKMLSYEAVDRNNEIINPDEMEESICSSTLPCILYFLYYGFKESSIEMNLISFKYDTTYYFRQFFFNMISYIILYLIFDNIFLITITNAFDSMKEKLDSKDNEKYNVCFICSKTRNDCIEDNEDFDEHIEKHNMWKYIKYICYIILKNKETYSNDENYLWKQIKWKEMDWFPKYEGEDKDNDNEK